MVYYIEDDNSIYTLIESAIDYVEGCINEEYEIDEELLETCVNYILEMKSKEQYAWEKWKKHYNFKPFKTDKTGRVGTIEVDGRTIKADMRKNIYKDKKGTLDKFEEIKQKTIKDRKNPNKGYLINDDGTKREVDLNELRKKMLDHNKIGTSVLTKVHKKNGKDNKVSSTVYRGDNKLFGRSFKNAKMMTDHEIGHAIDHSQLHMADKKGDVHADDDEMFDKLINSTKYFDNISKITNTKSAEECDHANAAEGTADRYAANKSGTKNVKHLINRLYKDNRKTNSAKGNKMAQVDMDVRRKMLKDPLLGSYKLDDEKKDYGKDVKKNPDSKNVSKKRRNMNQERQEKKKTKFKYDK